jgi:hypothetical protein
MRSLEVHHLQTEDDLELALTSGLILPEQVAATDCMECETLVCYSDTKNLFIPFLLVLDEDDQDWVLCEDCASPMLKFTDTFFPPAVASHFSESYEDFEPF